METAIKRKRSLYFAFAVITTICGLLSRSQSIPLPDIISIYGGDTLWALMVFWCFCLIAPEGKTWKIIMTALMFAFMIEFSQFYRATWIDILRATKIGGLILGFGFKMSDLVCYSVGILFGAVVDTLLIKGWGE